VLVVWQRVTPSDHNLLRPPPEVLQRVTDRRAVQLWDDDRVLSTVMVSDLPESALARVAERTPGSNPIVWDCVALFGPGARWDRHFPTPAWAGRPVADVADSLARQLAALRAAREIPAR